MPCFYGSTVKDIRFYGSTVKDIRMSDAHEDHEHNQDPTFYRSPGDAAAAPGMLPVAEADRLSLEQEPGRPGVRCRSPPRSATPRRRDRGQARVSVRLVHPQRHDQS